MTDADELLELERSGWNALSTGGDAAASFYGDVLAEQTLMLMPGGMVIDDRQEALTAMSGAPWESFELENERVVRLTDDCALVAYRAHARRGDSTYDAWCASTYVRDTAGWRLAVHQQTPV